MGGFLSQKRYLGCSLQNCPRNAYRILPHLANEKTDWLPCGWAAPAGGGSLLSRAKTAGSSIGRLGGGKLAGNAGSVGRFRQVVERVHVPVLGFDDSGVLAVGVDPAIDRPSLAVALLDENGGPMGPTGDPAQVVVLGERDADRMMFQKAIVLQHRHVARGIGRLVDAVLLRRVARARQVHPGAIILGADDVANAPFHPADRVGDGAPLLEGRVSLPGLRHELGEI